MENLGESARSSAFPDTDQDASKLAQRVLKDIDRGQIVSGEEINFIGLSEGETIALNAAEILNRPQKTINNAVFIGGYTLRGVPGNIQNSVSIQSAFDPIPSLGTQPGVSKYVFLNDIPFHDSYFKGSYRQEVLKATGDNLK